LILRSIDHACEPIIHQSLHGLCLFQAPGKIDQDPSLRLHLSSQFKLSTQLLFPGWPTSALALCGGSLALGLGVGTSIGGLKFGKLLEDLLFFKNVCLNLIDLGLFRFVLSEGQFKFLNEKVHKKGFIGHQSG
jgi:hypothetical protein